MNDNVTIVFTDGACSGNPGRGGWGAIVARPDTVEELGGGDPSTTNNRMELTAAIVALESLAKKKTPVKLYTDSQYLVQGATGWIFGWRKNGWKTAQGGDVQNRDLWERLGALPADLKVEWNHIPGHSRVPANERCDRIALGFASEKPIELFRGKRAKYLIDLALPTNLKERAEWRAQNKKKGQSYYLSYMNGKLERHKTWPECEARVKGATGAKYQKCASAAEETDILSRWGVPAERR